MAGFGRARQNAMAEGCPQNNLKGGRWKRQCRIETGGAGMFRTVGDTTLGQILIANRIS